MKKASKLYNVRISVTCVLLVVSLCFLPACSQKSTEGAGKGAAVGGAAGAVAGIVSSLVFGGNVGEAAARGAVWAATAGAVTGGIAGAEANRAEQEMQAKKRMENLKSELGEDAYNGLLALAECKHDIAIGYARTSAESNNPDFSLAGIWLEILAQADRGKESEAESLFPLLMEKDEKLDSSEKVSSFLAEATEKLKTVRKDYNLDEKCQ